MTDPKALAAKLRVMAKETRDNIAEGNVASEFVEEVADEAKTMDQAANALEEASDDKAEVVLEAVQELQSLRRQLAADLGNIKTPAVSRTKREILDETIDRIEVALKLIEEAETKK